METGPGPIRKPGVRESDVVVTILAGLLSRFRVFVIVGTFLALCVAVYAIAWAARHR